MTPSLVSTLIAVATSFCCHGAGGGYCGTTASGVPVGPGQIAADPAVLPLGTRVVVEGYGPATVTDTGSAIRGQRIDVFYDECTRARAWGRRTVAVQIAGPATSAAPAAEPVERAVYPEGDGWTEVTRWHDPTTGDEWDTFAPAAAPAAIA